MNKTLIGAATVLGLVISGAVQAGGAWTGRAGLTGGTYKFNDKFTDRGCCGSPGAATTTDYSTGTYGLLAGTGLGIDRFIADLGVEYDKYSKKEGGSNRYRTDGLLTLGAFIGDRWTAFAGYRYATFGDGFFTKKGGNSEDGPFIGGGVSFRAGKSVSLGGSAAYNRPKLKTDDPTLQAFFDGLKLNGYSVKLQANFLGTPHSIFLRWQRFDGDIEKASQFSYEYTENYYNLGYQATFDFTTWH